MKLLAIIVNGGDERKLGQELTRMGHRYTVISTTGGFLRQGSATLLVGTADDKVNEVMAVIQRSCHTRTQFANPQPSVLEPNSFGPNFVEIQVGGAIVFVLNVERFEKM